MTMLPAVRYTFDTHLETLIKVLKDSHAVNGMPPNIRDTPAFRWNKRWKILPPTNDKRMVAKYLATSNFTCHNLQLWLAINVFFPTAVPGTHSSLESRTSSASGPTPGGITGIRGQDGRSGAQSRRALAMIHSLYKQHMRIPLPIDVPFTSLFHVEILQLRLCANMLHMLFEPASSTKSRLRVNFWE